ncbi:hypothetical protein ACIBJC_14930 [Streptomyces sp. NPDC050509]|uniref:hypothetical protein n=1 Tax=Streptomyces sp. NPDC050509 TaxID=3365620 RepID=UPI0037B4A160
MTTRTDTRTGSGDGPGNGSGSGNGSGCGPGADSGGAVSDSVSDSVSVSDSGAGSGSGSGSDLGAAAGPEARAPRPPHPPLPPRRGPGPSFLIRFQRFLTWPPLLIAAALWTWSLPRIGFRDIGEFGLLDRFPAAFYASLAVLSAGFLISLRRAGTAPWWPLTYCVAMLVALKAPPGILYDSVRYAWASKHDAVIARLLAEGTFHPQARLSGGMSAYDQWPGFFSLNAALIRAFGVHGAASYTNWAPVLFGLLMLPVLILIYRTFTDDWRLVWTAVWIFQLANWVGQDYLAPQAFAYLLFLTVFAVVVRHFVRPGSAGRLRERSRLDPSATSVPPPTTLRQRAVCVAILAPLIGAINASHQLTPVMLCMTLTALCLTRRYRNIGLLVVTGLLMLVWDLTMGRVLFLDTLSTLRDSAGDLLKNSRPGFAGEPTGPGPELVGTANILMVLVLGGLAVAAVLLRRRLARSALPLLLAAAAPVPLFAVNDYGGEMLFRVYLFGLPGTAFFAAAALVPPAAGREKARRLARRATAFALPVALAALLVGFLPSYYGKEGMQYAPPAESAFVERAYDQAPDGSLILATTGSFPGAYYRYDHYERWFFTEQEVPENLIMLKDPARYLDAGIPDGRPAYVILTPSQEKATIGEGYLPAGSFARMTEALKRSPHFRVLEESRNGLLLEHVETPTPDPVPEPTPAPATPATPAASVAAAPTAAATPTPAPAR